MPPILNAQKLSKRFGATLLFESIDFTVSEGDRIGLIGPNGAGKSTLLAVLAGEQWADSGDVARRKGARVGYVKQESQFPPETTVRSVLEQAMARTGVPSHDREALLRDIAGRAGFTTFDIDAATLSGGWRKRLAIAEALVTHPDVLILDEPTNHLDLAGIAWLEAMLSAASFACVIVSHDRYFLENVATQIVELNRIYAEGLLRVKGSYSKFLEGRSAYMEAQYRMQESLRNRVQTEIEWLRRGPKARTTKSKARIDNANELIGKLRDVEARSQTTTAGIEFTATERQTRRLVELEDVSLSFGEKKIVSHLSLLVTNGVRMGLVGPNGSGKTTLLRLITGELEPQAGAIRRATSLRVVYFSQLRELDQGTTLRRALAPDSDSVVYQGRVIHVAGYASRFLFTSEQLNQPVDRLSGGERARVLIAKLMLEPADVLLLDEPTNDLDIATLEILEDTLLEYSGALVLVTHDRYMLDRVSTTVLGLDGRGNALAFADYSQWEQWMRQAGTETGQAPTEKRVVDASPVTRKKLSYLEAREYAAIEQRVENADDRVRIAQAVIEDPKVTSDPAALMAALSELGEAQSEADALYVRWAELTEKTD